MYLKFVWGRSRLPIDLKNLSQKHTLTLCRGMNKTGFPLAHTCFFSLDLPEYEDEKVMRDKFLVAITLVKSHYYYYYYYYCNCKKSVIVSFECVFWLVERRN